MTKWIVGESYQHKLSGVKIRMIGWTTDGRPVVERHEQPFDQYTCYDLAKCAIDFYDHVPSSKAMNDYMCDHRKDSQGHCVFDCDRSS